MFSGLERGGGVHANHCPHLEVLNSGERRILIGISAQAARRRVAWVVLRSKGSWALDRD